MQTFFTEIKSRLDQEEKYRDLLFRRNFLISERSFDSQSYPFYGKWNKHSLGRYTVMIHPKEHVYFASEVTSAYHLALFGHAWNPYTEVIDETVIAKELLDRYLNDKNDFYNLLDALTGIFVIVVEHNGALYVVQDCSGPIAIFFGKINGEVALGSSPQLIADLYHLGFDKDAERLMDSKGYKRGSGFLPGNLTPYKELKRLGCNTELIYDNSTYHIRRFFPREQCVAIGSDEEKQQVVSQMAWLMTKNIDLAMKKWERLSLSLSGGIDSGTEFACANHHYDELYVFSFASKDSELIDAHAAAEICQKLGVTHHFYQIPKNNEEIEDYDFLAKLIEHNNFYASKIHPNEKRKFIFLERKDDFNAEFKGDVSEIGRAFADRKYYKVKMPRIMAPRHLTITQGRYFLEPWAIKFADSAFRSFMVETALEDDICGYTMQDLSYWEVKTGSWAATVYNMQAFMHQIVMIYNNRNLMKLFLRFPKNERACDLPHLRIIEEVNPDFAKVHSQVKDSYFGFKRMFLETVYYYYSTRLNTLGSN